MVVCRQTSQQEMLRLKDCRTESGSLDCAAVRICSSSKWGSRYVSSAGSASVSGLDTDMVDVDSLGSGFIDKGTDPQVLLILLRCLCSERMEVQIQSIQDVTGRHTPTVGSLGWGA